MCPFELEAKNLEYFWALRKFGRFNFCSQGARLAVREFVWARAASQVNYM
jgi:hypothetical protein